MYKTGMITLSQDNKFIGFVKPDGANGIDTDALLRDVCYVVKQAGFKLATDIEKPAGGARA